MDANSIATIEQEELLLENKENYTEIIKLYEQKVERESDNIKNYWYLGLAYLLEGYEAEAQTTWFLGISNVDEEFIDSYTLELCNILEKNAQHQFQIDNFDKAWSIRQHYRELFPDNLNNLLGLLLLSLVMENYSVEVLREWDIIQKLSDSRSEDVDFKIITQILCYLLYTQNPKTIDFLRACFKHASDVNDFINFVVKIAIDVAYKHFLIHFAAQMLEVCLEFLPNKFSVLQHISCFYSNSGNHAKAIAKAKELKDISQQPARKVIGSYLVLRALLTASSWEEVPHFYEENIRLLSQFIQEKIPVGDKADNAALFVAPYFLPYLKDDIRENRLLRNQISQIFHDNLQSLVESNCRYIDSPQTKAKDKLKIGYIASTLRSHSVGWLSRWLFHYHDRSSFSINLYLVHQDMEDKFMQNFFRSKADTTSTFTSEVEEIAQQIKDDEIDILIDLDSVTHDSTSAVMAIRPAPIQVTWLGSDASGIPSIDHYIVDPYVLGDDAQQYYTENLWRLPETYIAVDGFEVGVPTLKREDLDIPHDAVTFFSAQVGYKRHPDTIKLQLQIIKEVPNSYFLIKGIGDKGIIRDYFTKLAQEVGVSSDRLRFLDRDTDELTHRANLTIADVVLDTYPYNGATTTLETLWMCIPMVTRVGEQFAARNSYTFMKNAGIEEGIAWTDEEYVEWGVRLGKDKALRWKIAGKLRESRQTSPLWNAKKFTQEMENAYRQMWAKYVEKV